MEIKPDEHKPLYGPFCPGLHLGKTWTLTIEEGQMGLSSGCPDCDDAVMGPVGGEDVFMTGTIKGHLVGHLETYGWESPEYDYWWEFIPDEVA